MKLRNLLTIASFILALPICANAQDADLVSNPTAILHSDFDPFGASLRGVRLNDAAEQLEKLGQPTEENEYGWKFYWDGNGIRVQNGKVSEFGLGPKSLQRLGIQSTEQLESRLGRADRVINTTLLDDGKITEYYYFKRHAKFAFDRAGRMFLANIFAETMSNPQTNETCEPK